MVFEASADTQGLSFSEMQLIIKTVEAVQFHSVMGGCMTELQREALKVMVTLTDSRWGFVCEVLDENNPLDSLNFVTSFDRDAPDAHPDVATFNINPHRSPFFGALFDREGIILNKKIKKPSGSDFPDIYNYCSAAIISGQRLIGMVGLASNPNGYKERNLRAIRPICAATAHTVRAFRMKKREEKIIQALEKSNQELRNFAHICAHDLREPLRSISSFAQIMSREESACNDNSRIYLNHITKCSKRMGDLIDDVLQHATMGTAPLTLEWIEFDDLIHMVKEDLDVYIREHNAEVVVHNSIKIRADIIRIKRVFQNLIQNGIKFNASATPKIDLDVHLEGGRAIMSVKDNGIGIDPSYQHLAFNFLSRLHSTRQYEGSGVGLSYVKKIVEEHGGEVKLSSSLEQGSTFFIALPHA